MERTKESLMIHSHPTPNIRYIPISTTSLLQQARSSVPPSIYAKADKFYSTIHPHPTPNIRYIPISTTSLLQQARSSVPPSIYAKAGKFYPLASPIRLSRCVHATASGGSRPPSGPAQRRSASISISSAFRSIRARSVFGYATALAHSDERYAERASKGRDVSKTGAVTEHAEDGARMLEWLRQTRAAFDSGRRDLGWSSVRDERLGAAHLECGGSRLRRGC
ncbi:hypothetical protein F1559_000530 [Cyanidiococcus yangmingshanensis]|uniref:Uncharacterized protein n=1 Tax=Cyanidiococcus yangmingshanensis TaxID=2690220 RepID=A0A7J7IKU0_9RHOD|nr:hypothetical protein F1559_000530 [Cyanidiococcus yangmingshanensis]